MSPAAAHHVTHVTLTIDPSDLDVLRRAAMFASMDKDRFTNLERQQLAAIESVLDRPVSTLTAAPVGPSEEQVRREAAARVLAELRDCRRESQP